MKIFGPVDLVSRRHGLASRELLDLLDVGADATLGIEVHANEFSYQWGEFMPDLRRRPRP